MKRLWKYIMPCESDISGFQSVIKNLNIIGIIDDSGRYKNKRIDVNSNIFVSKINENDITTGSESKIINIFKNEVMQYNPKIVLFTSSPCASMICTDLDNISKKLESEYNIPTVFVNLNGEKDYLYGISNTLLEIGKKILRNKKAIPNTVNILGGNTIDNSLLLQQELESLLNKKSIKILSKWGTNELLENLKDATAAEKNIVINIAGLKLAKFMKEKFNIPYTIDIPIYNINHIVNNIKTNSNILIIDEQISSINLRNNLKIFLENNIYIGSFLEMDKTLNEKNDKKFTSEDDLEEFLKDKKIGVVIGRDDYKNIITKNNILFVRKDDFDETDSNLW